VGAALVARSYQRLAAVDIGFDPAGTVAFQVPRPSTASPDSSIAFYNELLRRLGEQPGIEAAGLIQALPLRSSAMGAGFPIEGRSGEGSSILSYWRVISPDYFRAAGIPLLNGRSVAATDVDGAQPVAVVTESFARRAWPGDTPLGKRIGWGTLERPITVVGVVGDIRTAPAAEPGPHVYMPFQQAPRRLPDELVVRSSLGTAAVIDVVRRTVWSLDRAQPIAGISTMEALFDRSLGRRRFHLTLFSLFAGVAVALAMVGIYGVLSYMVGEMAAEVGLRLALGATPGMVIRTVLKSGLRTAAAGIAVGTILAVWSAGLLRGFLFQLDARDPATYVAAGVALIAGSIVACLIPALRAARVDPLSAIRN
jgi:putative ABC transport system permease protein